MIRKSAAALGALAILAIPAAAQNYEYTSQSNLSQIKVTSTLHATRDGTGFAVGILDGKADASSQDLSGKITVLTPYAGTFSAPDDHGSHTSGIAAAAANGWGIAGVAPGAHVYNYAVFDDTDWIAYDDGRAALDDMASRNGSGAGIVAVNMSYGCYGSAFCSGELATLDDYLDDFVIARAAGNDGRTLSNYAYQDAATALANILIVGSVGPANRLSVFSNRPGNGSFLETTCSGRRCKTKKYSYSNMFIVAPGEGVLSDYGDGSVGRMSGTSMATPAVTGAVALVAQDAHAKGVDLSPASLASILKRSATDLGSKGVDNVYGWGLLNVQAALSAVGPTRVATGASVNGASAPLSRSRLQLTSAGRAGRLAASLAEGLIYLDAFDRPFALRMDKQRREPLLAGRAFPRASALADQSSFMVPALGSNAMAWNMTGEGTGASGMEFSGDGYEAGFAMGDALLVGGLKADGRAARAGELALAAYDEGIANIGNLTTAFAAQDYGDAWQVESYLATSLLSPEAEAGEGSHASLAGFALNRKLSDGLSLGLTFSSLSEHDSLAGAQSTGAFALGGSNYTQSAGLQMKAELLEGISLSAFWSRFVTFSANSGESLFEVSGLGGDQFGVALSAADLFAKGDGLSLSLIKPMQLDRGRISAVIPVARDFDGSLTRQTREAVITRDGFPLHLSLGYRQQQGAWSRGLSLDVMDSDASASGGYSGALTAAAAFSF